MAAPEKPLTRKESYLAEIAGQNVVIPEKPLTREESYLAAIAGQNVIVPDKPITREEAYLDAILQGGGGGGGSTLIAKTITENGTYDPKDDDADGYSSVEVNVDSGGVNFYLDNGKIATSAGEYITTNLLQELPANTLLLLAMEDGAKKLNDIIFYAGGTQAFSIDGGAYTLTITPTTAGLTYYGGDYRNIYAKLSELDPAQIY